MSLRELALVIGTTLVVPMTKPQAQDRPQGNRQLIFGKPTELLRDIELNALGDVALGPQGTAFVLDASNYQVVALDSMGKVLWRAGRKGDGPGEFRVLARITARPSGGVAALDWGNGRVTLFSATGQPERALKLPITFTQIDGFLIVPDGRFLVAGMTGWGTSTTSDRSVHVFSDSLVYQSSFAPPAAAIDTSAVRYVGSGGFALDRNGRLLFTPKRPFEVQRYVLEGTLIDRIPIAVKLQYDLGDFIAVQRNGRQVFKSITEKTRFVEIPVPFVEIPGGGFLGGRATFEKTTVDLISSTGVLEASITNPKGCVQILAIDALRNLLYCKALRDDAPILLRVPLTVRSASR